jgi:hypothetical protein
MINVCDPSPIPANEILQGLERARSQEVVRKGAEESLEGLVDFGNGFLSLLVSTEACGSLRE